MILLILTAAIGLGLAIRPALAHDRKARACMECGLVQSGGQRWHT